MTYLIDGHNLIGQLPDISLADPDDEARLVQKLIGFTARVRKRAVVVFDHGLPGGKSRMSTNTVEVIFASRPGDADAIMKGRINAARDPAHWTVVSNDLAVIEVAKARRMKTMRCQEFVSLLNDTESARREASRAEGEAHEPRVSPQEVEEWLKVFGSSSPTPVPRRRRNL